jgi:hypothetical protein
MCYNSYVYYMAGQCFNILKYLLIACVIIIVRHCILTIRLTAWVKNPTID